MPVEVVHMGTPDMDARERFDTGLPARVESWIRLMCVWRDGNLRQVRGYVILESDTGRGTVVEHTRP